MQVSYKKKMLAISESDLKRGQNRRILATGKDKWG